MKIKRLAYITISALLLAGLSACGNKAAGTGSQAVETENAVLDSVDDGESKASGNASESNDENSSEETNSGGASSESSTSQSSDSASSSSDSSKSSASVDEKPAIVDKTWEYHVDISWIDPEKPMVALSFDDGPVYSTGENSTAIRIQNAIADNGMHATFFYWGTTLNGITQKEIERAYELGFELGNHTKTHADLGKLLTSEEIEKEVSYMDKKLNEIAPEQEHFLVRPPYLSVNQRVKDTLIAPLISCGIDTKDWNGASAESIINTIVSAVENDTLNGQIVLMHETYTTTAEAVEYLVPYLKEQGYQVVSISEMYCARGKTMAGGKVFTSCAK